MLGRPTNYRARNAGDHRSRHRLLLTPPGRPTDARPPVQRRPRFDGDVSELPDRACWALQHLLTRRYISAEADADVYSWVLEYRKELSVRLSELDLLLRIVDGDRRRLRRTGPLRIRKGHQASAPRTARHLRLHPRPAPRPDDARLRRADRGHQPRGDARPVLRHLNDTDRDAVTFTARIDGAIARLNGLEIRARPATTRTATPSAPSSAPS